MITLDVINGGHYTISANEPVTIEVTPLPNGGHVAHVYRGGEVDHDEEPVGCYDSSVHNTSWFSDFIKLED